jgi:hypothetical protein
MPFLFGFISGVLASIFTTGMRKMLAPIIFRRKVSAGKLYKCGLSGHEYWCIYISVDVSSWWKLLKASLEDVEAVISYTEADGSKVSCKTTWIKSGTDVQSVILYIGGIYYGVRVAVEPGGGQLLPLNGNTGKLFLDNQDIILELICGRDSLG